MHALERCCGRAAPLPRAVHARSPASRDADLAGAPRIDGVAPALRAALAGRTIVAHNAEFERALPRALRRAALARAPLPRHASTCSRSRIPTRPTCGSRRFTRALLGTRGAPPRARRRARHGARDLALAGAGAARGRGALRGGARARSRRFAPDSPWLALLGKERALRRARRPPRRSSSRSARRARRACRSTRTRSPRRSPTRRAAGATSRATACARSRSRLARAVRADCSTTEVLLLEGGTGVGKSLAYLAAAIPFAMRARRGRRARAGRRLDAHEAAPGPAPRQGHRRGGALPRLPGPARALDQGPRELRVRSGGSQQVLAEGREPGLVPRATASPTPCSRRARARARTARSARCPARCSRRYPPLRELLRRSVAPRAEHCTREQCAAERCVPARPPPRGARATRTSSSRTTISCCAGRPTTRASSTRSSTRRTSSPSVADEAYALEVRPDEVLERFDELFGRPRRAGARARRSAARAGARRRATTTRSPGAASSRRTCVALGARARAARGRLRRRAAARDAPGAAFAAARRARARAAAARLDDARRPRRARRASASETRRRRSTRALARAARRRRRRCALAFDGRADATPSRPSRSSWRRSTAGASPCATCRPRRRFHESCSARVAVVRRRLGEPLRRRRRLRGARRRSSSRSARGERCSATRCRARSRTRRTCASSRSTETRRSRRATPRPCSPSSRARLGGRTLGLFTSLRRMDEVAERARAARCAREGIEVLAPRRAHRRPGRAGRALRGTGGGVLLGARKFWQGLDIPGDDARRRS